jgi:hypothetical protein
MSVLEALFFASPKLELNIMLTILLIVLLVLALGGGSWGHSRYGYAGWSPAGIIVLVLVVLWLTGRLA